MAIEVEAARLAAFRRTPLHIRAIRSALALREARRDEKSAFVTADMAFHRAVVVAAQNDILVDVFDRFVPRCRLAMIDLLDLVQVNEVDPHSHDKVAAAIEVGDAIAAASLTRGHLAHLAVELSKLR